METREYFVWFKHEDSLIIKVKDDVNRPNNDDCDTVLQRWIHENYGELEYEYFELDSVEVVEL